MKLLDRYVLWSILKVAIITILLCTLMLVGVDLFSNLDNYLQREVSWDNIIKMCLLYVPEAVIIVMGPALLFSTTYFLSMLQANNEMISLFNAGIPYRRIIIPCVLMAVLLSLGQFYFNEYVAIPSSLKRNVMRDELFGQRSTDDNRNVTLSDLEGGFVIHASRYIAKDQRISDVVLVVRDGQGRITSRINAIRGQWDAARNIWVFKDVTKYDIDSNTLEVTPSYHAEYEDPSIDIEPELFRNLSADIMTMELETAIRYLGRMKYLDPSQWAIYSTDFWQRVLTCLTPLILMLIACSMDYKFKKNVLLFSIIASLCIAVVYYVLQMLTLILAKQGVLPPISGMLIPMFAVFLLPLGTSLLIRR